MFSGYLSEIRAKPHHPFTPRNVLFSPIILVNGVEESPFVTEILFGCVYAPVFAKNDLWSGTSKSLFVISRYSISKHRPERHLIRRKLLRMHSRVRSPDPPRSLARIVPVDRSTASSRGSGSSSTLRSWANRGRSWQLRPSRSWSQAKRNNPRPSPSNVPSPGTETGTHITLPASSSIPDSRPPLTESSREKRLKLTQEHRSGMPSKVLLQRTDPLSAISQFRGE